MSESSVELESQLIERVVEQRNKLLEDAAKKVIQITKSAEDTVARISKESETEILSLIGSDLNAARDRIIGNAQLEGRKKLILARQDILTGVFDEVLEDLRGIARGDDRNIKRGNLLAALIKESAEAIGGNNFIARANKADFEYLEKNLGEIRASLNQSLGECNFSLDSEPIDIVGGVVVRNEDGTKTYYNTLEGRLANVRTMLESEIAEKLGVL
jgi:vacuolar-type H+-ATPase subunit E/Vma4